MWKSRLLVKVPNAKIGSLGLMKRFEERLNKPLLNIVEDFADFFGHDPTDFPQTPSPDSKNSHSRERKYVPING